MGYFYTFGLIFAVFSLIGMCFTLYFKYTQNARMYVETSFATAILMAISTTFVLVVNPTISNSSYFPIQLMVWFAGIGLGVLAYSHYESEKANNVYTLHNRFAFSTLVFATSVLIHFGDHIDRLC